jgi:phosphatidylglycerol:prolipoprotein diacylglycerol transferase
MAAPGVMIAQALGRWGNFVNGEAYGYAIGDTTRFFFFNKELVLSSGEGTIFHFFRMGLRQGGVWTYYHPTFFYESIWNILGFVLINLFYKHKRFHGQIALMYFTWYGFGRMFIEGLRQDSLYIGSFRVSQLLAALLFIVSFVLIIALFIKNRERHVARCIYTSDSPKYIAYEVENGKDPDYDYDINILYTKSSAKSEETVKNAEIEITPEIVDSLEAEEEVQKESEEIAETVEVTEEITVAEENIENEEISEASEENPQEISEEAPTDTENE